MIHVKTNNALLTFNKIFIKKYYLTFFQLFITLIFYAQTYNDNQSKTIQTKLKQQNIAESFNELANYYYNAQKFPEALELYEKASVEFEKNNDFLNKAQALRHIGLVYSDINDYQNALKHYLIALELYENLNKKELTANIISDIGELHLKFENFTKAFEYLFKANKLYLKDKFNSKEQLKNNYFLLGIAYGSVDKIDSSLYYFEKILNQTTPNGNELFYGGLLNNIGAIYSKKNELNKAFQYYNDALKIFYKVKSEKGIGISISNIAYIKKKERKYTESAALYTQAITYLAKVNDLNNMADSYINLSEVYEANGNPIQALINAKKYIKINDSLNNSDLISTIADLEIQQEMRKKDQEIKIIEQQKQIAEKDNKLKKLWFYILAGSITLILIISALIFINLKTSLKHNQLKQNILNKEKIQLESNLEYKNKELEKFALHIIEKNELLVQLKNELKEINTQQPENDKRVREISATITNNLQIDKDRKEFEFQLDNIHQSFFLKLDHLFPELSKSERRLCSLLVMDLSSKDIATILNISPDGVKKSRYRLRKKLNLNEELNISEFLKKI